jgi:FtsP/CotA-like multicopper oxidase with cupredoxin domain
MRFTLSILLIVLVQSSFAGVVTDTVYINRGVFTAVDSTQFNYIAFNTDTAFKQTNAVLQIDLGDTLCLTIINTDTLQHHFTYTGGGSTLIAAGDTASTCISYSNSGAYQYYDDSNFPVNAYLGLSGIIHVKDGNTPTFYWNMKDHDANWNQTAEQSSPDWSTYYPRYFTLNGLSHPQTNMDSTSRIIANVGDTVHIILSNTGIGVRSIHLHGYHAKILFSSKHPSHVGRDKDTFPVMPMESLLLELIPHQAGEYPVHEHNLVGVSANNMYPNGMFSTILIY